MGSGYPAGAYAPTGELWWKLDTTPGTSRPFGDEQKIAAYLASNKSVGDTFTTRELREAISRKDGKNDAEHFQRRIRNLRGPRDGWAIASHQDDPTLPYEHYRIDRIGWHPGVGPRPKNTQAVSVKLRAFVIERDGSRCRICGVAAGDAYYDIPDKIAVMTVGHIIPQIEGGSSNPDNLRAECSLCNEQKRQEGFAPENLDDLWDDILTLNPDQMDRLLIWVSEGQRTRDHLDIIYDRSRKLSEDNHNKLLEQLTETVTHVHRSTVCLPVIGHHNDNPKELKTAS